MPIYQVLRRIVDYKNEVILDPTLPKNKKLSVLKQVYIDAPEAWAKTKGERMLREVNKVPKGSQIEVKKVEPVNYKEVKAKKIEGHAPIITKEVVKEPAEVVEEPKTTSKRTVRKQS